MHQRSDKAQYFYNIFFVACILSVHVLSSYLYFVTTNKLEPKILYFPSATTSKELRPELHNLPIRDLVTTGKNVYHSDLEILVRELMLGPQSIYLKNLTLGHVTLDLVMYSRYNQENRAFIFLATENQRLDTEQKQELWSWFRQNIRIYYPQVEVFIFLDGKIIAPP